MYANCKEFLLALKKIAGTDDWTNEFYEVLDLLSEVRMKSFEICINFNWLIDLKYLKTLLMIRLLSTLFTLFYSFFFL